MRRRGAHTRSRTRVVPPVHPGAAKLIYAFSPRRAPLARRFGMEVNALMVLYATYSSLPAFPYYTLAVIAKVNPSWRLRALALLRGKGDQ